MGRRLAVILVGGVAACTEVPPPGGLPDAAVLDSAADSEVDAASDEGTGEPGLPSGCFLDAPIDVHRAATPVVSLSFGSGAEDFLVAYTVASTGGRQVLVRHLDEHRTMHSPLVLTPDPGEYSQVALTSTSDGWLVAFSALAAGESRVLGQHLPEPALALEEEPPALTVLAGVGSSGPAFARSDEHILLAYRGPAEAAVGAYQRRLSADGTPSGDASLVAVDDVVDVRAVGGTSGFFVAWSDSDHRVLGRRLTSNSLGAITALNQGDPSPTGAFELGYSGATFAALAGVAELDVRTVRFRHVTESGSVLGQPSLLPYRRGEYADFSVARFAAGFAVAYRHAELGRHQLRIALLDVDGHQLFDTLLTSVFSGEGDIEIRQSTDGQLAVLWSDVSLEGDSVLRISGVRCSP